MFPPELGRSHRPLGPLMGMHKGQDCQELKVGEVSTPIEQPNLRELEGSVALPRTTSERQYLKSERFPKECTILQVSKRLKFFRRDSCRM